MIDRASNTILDILIFTIPSLLLGINNILHVRSAIISILPVAVNHHLFYISPNVIPCHGLLDHKTSKLHSVHVNLLLLNCSAGAAVNHIHTTYNRVLFGLRPSRHHRHVTSPNRAVAAIAKLQDTPKPTLFTPLHQQSVVALFQHQKLSVVPIFVSCRHRQDKHYSQRVHYINRQIMSCRIAEIRYSYHVLFMDS